MCDVSPKNPPLRRSAAGFSLIEVLVAMFILMVGLFALAQVFYLGLNIAATSTPNLIAREKAREAIESVHTARDTHDITWGDIRNAEAPTDCLDGTTGLAAETPANGFVNGAVPMRGPGEDGLVNTDDDEDAELEMLPGPDSLLDTDDDVPLVGYTRQIQICDVNANLRQITVTIRYPGSNAVGAREREYRIVTFISRFS
jgi:prepilin-type N-terminal cleavage/methylation domain-containing protein